MPPGSTLQDAKQTEARILTDPESFTTKQTDNPKCGFSFDAYYANAKLTKKSYKNDLQIYKSYMEGRDWKTTQGILVILAHAKELGRAPATVRHIYTTIKRIHNWHIECDLHPTGKNPCKYIKLPRVDNTVTNVLSEQDVSNMLKYLIDEEPNRFMAIVVSLAVLTGRRQGEILGLLKDDIDIERCTITCRQTKSGKTLSFPINDQARILLNEALQLSDPESAKVFKYNKNGFTTNWYRLRSRLIRKGVISKVVRFHDLRHTHATILANSGKVSLQTIQRLLGHSTIELTQRYAHLNDKTLKDAVDLLSSVV